MALSLGTTSTCCYILLQVETIGDAYMVVGGLPTRCSDHAERVCKQALDMIKYSQRVRNPVNGQNIEVSIVT